VSLDGLGSVADAAGAALTSAAGTLARLDTRIDALAAVPGRLGELGQAVHADLVAAFGSRSREAATHGARFADAGHLLRLVAAGYADSDAQAHRRHRDGDR
jgi:hypothetical protein